jgi:CRP-like cAMP-binding protein
VSRQSRGISGLGSPDTPRKLNSLQAPFWATAKLCLKSCAPLRRDLIPNGEAMLAEHFRTAAVVARTTASLDETARLTWRAHAEAQILDAEAEAISEAIEARRASLIGKGPAKLLKPALARPGGIRTIERREKMFGMGCPVALDRNAKVRIMHWARCLARRTEKGKAYGQVTAKALAVLEALLWGFHNAKSGVCFPSYERIAEAAGCARSTVSEALKALEGARILSWVNRIKRIREACPDLLGANGWRWRVLRTSNAYAFNDPSPAGAQANSSKSEKETGTPNQEFFSPIAADRGSVVDNGLLLQGIFWRKEARSAIVPSANRTEREVMK